MKKIGIKDIGIKTPLRKIKSEDIIKVWSNMSLYWIYENYFT